MAEEDEKTREDRARKDAEEKERADAARWDKVMGALDAICTRMDAFEEEKKEREDRARKDAEEAEEKAKADAEMKAKRDAEEEEKAKADKARKDEEEEKAKADAVVRADAEHIKALEGRLDAVVSHLAGNDDREAFGPAQARADAVYLAHGKQAPAPMVAEKALDYRRRLLAGIQASTKDWKDADFKTIPAGALFDQLEARVYADAAAAARDPSTATPGRLRPVVQRTPAGHTITEYVGDWRDGSAGLIQPFPRVGRLTRSSSAA